MNEPEIRQSAIHEVTFGERVTVIEPVNLYHCHLDEDCFVGPFTEIQSGVKIGKKTRIQSHSFICEGVTIGAECFIGHGVMFINDLFSDGGPARGDKSKYRPTIIEDGVSIGSNATILPVTICAGSIIGAGAVVTSDITVPGKYVGNPARRL